MTQILRTIDPRDTAKMRRIQGLCLREHIMPPPVAYVGAKVYQCPPHLLVNGRIPEGLKLDQLGIAPALVYDARSQSWVRNAYNIVVTQLLGIRNDEGGTYGAGGMYCKDTGGSNRSFSSAGTHHIRATTAAEGALGSTATGIVVGTGTGAESFEGYALGTIVANGTGAGQLSYAAQETTTASYNAGTKIWTSTMIRYMNNNSGGAIVVGEAACYVNAYTSETGYYYMLCRDLLSPTVSVADTAQLKVTYTIDSMAYPA
jgi:hypothetical protein